MKKFYILYLCLIAFSFCVLMIVHPLGVYGIASWSLWVNAMQLLVIIVESQGIKAHEILISPGFVKRYHTVFSENIEYAKENAKIAAELEWIKGKPAIYKSAVQQPHPGTKKFISSNNMSTKEKRIRAYLMSSQGITDNEIADKLGLKSSSIPGYRSDGKKIVEKYKQLIAGHSIDEIVDFFCGEDSSHA